MHSRFRSTGTTRVILVRHGQSTYNAEKRHQGCSDRAILTPKGIEMAHQTGPLLQNSDINVIYSSPLKRAYQTAQQILAAMPDRGSIVLHTSDQLQEIDLPAWEGLPYQVVRNRFADDYRHWKEQPHDFQMSFSQQFSLVKARLPVSQRFSNRVKSWRERSPQFQSSQFSQSVLLDGQEPTPLDQSSRFQRFRMIAPLIQRRFPVLDLYERASRFWQTIISRHCDQTLLVVAHGGTNRALISTALDFAPSHYHQLQQSNCGISILNFPADWHPSAQPAQLEMLNYTSHLGETLPKLKEGRQGLQLLLLPCTEESSGVTEPVAHLLQSVPIEFSISSDLPNCIAVAKQVLQSHRNGVQLQVVRQDFPQAWQLAIANCHLSANPKGDANSHDASSYPLVTGLAIAPATSIKHLIGHALELKPGQSNAIHPIPNTISVLHYPGTHPLPTLQALNFSSRLSQSL